MSTPAKTPPINYTDLIAAVVESNLPPAKAVLIGILLREMASMRAELGANSESLSFALKERLEEAKRYRWGIRNAAWLRHEHCAYVAIPVDLKADLSCVALCDDAIGKAVEAAEKKAAGHR